MVFDSIRRQGTGLPVIDAQFDFNRARRAYFLARIGRRLVRRGRRGRPLALPRSGALAAGPSTLEVVPLKAIVGTLDPTAEFDSVFRPASNRVRHRWEQIALVHRRGGALPPIVLRRQPDGYYIVDGRHRVSVARTLRHRDIAAWITGPRT
jgi:hypothetical protein